MKHHSNCKLSGRALPRCTDVHIGYWVLALMVGMALACDSGDKAGAGRSATTVGETEQQRAQYEGLIRQLSSCRITKSGLDDSCPAYKQLRAAGTGKHAQNVIVEAIAREEHPDFIVALMDIVASSASDNPKVGKMLLEQMGHAAAAVRKKAIYALTSPAAKGVVGRVPKLVAAMEKDADIYVREKACEYAGKTGDSRLIPVYRKLTENSIESGLYADCMRGLVATWLSWPSYTTTSEAGYRLTLERLKQTPRDDLHPPSLVMSEFTHLEDATNDKLEEWATKATFYDKRELAGVLTDIVKDEAAGWMVRSSVVRVLAKLLNEKQLEALAKDCAKCNSHVAKALSEAVANKK